MKNELFYLIIYFADSLQQKPSVTIVYNTPCNWFQHPRFGKAALEDICVGNKSIIVLLGGGWGPFGVFFMLNWTDFVVYILKAKLNFWRPNHHIKLEKR